MKISFLKTFRISFGLIAALLISTIAVSAQSGGIKGKVRSSTGQAVGNAALTLTNGDEDIKTVRSGRDGSFEMKGVEAGTYGLRVDADGYASGSLFSVEVKKRQGPRSRR